jgi:hypothetical protein
VERAGPDERAVPAEGAGHEKGGAVGPEMTNEDKSYGISTPTQSTIYYCQGPLLSVQIQFRFQKICSSQCRFRYTHDPLKGLSHQFESDSGMVGKSKNRRRTAKCFKKISTAPST